MKKLIVIGSPSEASTIAVELAMMRTDMHVEIKTVQEVEDQFKTKIPIRNIELATVKVERLGIPDDGRARRRERRKQERNNGK